MNNTLSNQDHKIMDEYINEVLEAFNSGKIDKSEAAAYFAHVITLMQNEGASACVAHFKALLDRRPNIDWTPGR